MLKKSMLLLLMVFNVGFSLMGSEGKPKGHRFTKNQIEQNINLNNRDQWIKGVVTLLPVAVVGASIFKATRDGMNYNEGLFCFGAGTVASMFTLAVYGIMNYMEEKRNTLITTLRATLPKPQS